MDDRLRLIQYLYDEEIDDPTFARRLTEDEALYREYERLRTTKDDLDNRPARRPDRKVVDQVVDRARIVAQESSAPARSSGDRPPRRPNPTWTRRLQAAGAALALGLLVGLGWWQEGGLIEGPAMTSSPETAKPAPAANASASEQAIPAWDDSDELVRIHQRIEQLQAHSGPDAWGSLQTVSKPRP